MGERKSGHVGLVPPYVDDFVFVSRSDLKSIGSRPTLRNYLKRTWELRHFVLGQARYRALSGGQGMFLGRIWLMLEPFLRILMFYIIFAVILHVDRGIENFIAFLAIGVIFFFPMNRSLSAGAGVINRNRALVRGFAFPRFALVLSEGIKDFVDAIPAIAALLLFIWIFPPHAPPTWTWLLFPFALIFRHIFMTGLMLITAYLSAKVPDTKKIWPLIGRFWFYSSGVFFSVEHRITDPTLAVIAKSNPGYVMLDFARAFLLRGEIPGIGQWLQVAGWATFVFLIGMYIFWRGEELYNRVL